MAASSAPLDLDTIVLARGSHDPEDGEVCLMEAVSVLAGEPFTDHPSCTSPVIAAFLRSWQDALGDEERQQLKRWALPVMGTNTGPENDEIRAWIATDWLVRTQTPAWLRLAGLTEQADLLAGMPELRPDTVPTIRPVLEAVRKDARSAGAAARDAAGAAARAAARDAARDAARAAAGAAARDAAGDAARDAAGAAARDAAWDAARDAAWAAARAAARAAAWDAAWDAAWAAARERLAPTVTELQASAHTLIERMIAVGKDAA